MNSKADKLNLDLEWVQLLKTARDLGISPDSIRSFFESESKEYPQE